MTKRREFKLKCRHIGPYVCGGVQLSWLGSNRSRLRNNAREEKICGWKSNHAHLLLVLHVVGAAMINWHGLAAINVHSSMSVRLSHFLLARYAAFSNGMRACMNARFLGGNCKLRVISHLVMQFTYDKKLVESYNLKYWSRRRVNNCVRDGDERDRRYPQMKWKVWSLAQKLRSAYRRARAAS